MKYIIDSRLDRSLDNLFNTLEESADQVILLVNLVHRLAKGVNGVSTEEKCDIIEDSAIIPDYLGTYNCDYLILVTPGKAPVYLDRDAFDRMSVEELLNWLKMNWAPETVAIPLP